MEGIDFIGLGIAVIIAGMGAYMCATGDPRLLHGYHYATTPACELPVLARETGAGLIGCGVSAGFIMMTVLPDWFTIMGVVIMVASIAWMLAAIVRHNGGLVTFGGASTTRGFLPTMSMRGRVAVFALVGAACSLFGIVPGVQMIATGDVSSLHEYHYANVALNDLPRLATAEGACMIVLGLAIFVCVIGSVGMLSGTRPIPLWSRLTLILGGVLFCAALVGMLGAIIYFNGSLMG